MGWMDKYEKAQRGMHVPEHPHLAPGINPEMLKRQAWKESSFRPDVENKLGFKGLAQVGDDAIADYKRATGKKIDPFNPKDAKAIQEWYMNQLYNTSFIDKPNQSEKVRQAKTLASYNWGKGNVLKSLTKSKKAGVDIYNSLDWLDSMPKETSDYVNKIQGRDEKFNREFDSISKLPKYKSIIDMYQNGGVLPDREYVTPERIEEGRQRVLDYYSSPGYLRLLEKNYENPKEEQLIRINNVKSAKLSDEGDINAYTPDTHSVRFSPHFYKDVTEHEFLHAGTRGPKRISDNEKYTILMNVSDPHRDNYMEVGLEPYIEIPEEYQARLGIARMLMKENDLYDYNEEEFTQKHLDAIKKDMKENPKRWNIKGFQDVIKSRESDDALIEVMNTVAINDDRGQWAHPGKITKINSNNITMKGVNYPVLGISDTGDERLMMPGGEYTFKGENVTEIPLKAKSGWLEKYNK